MTYPPEHYRTGSFGVDGPFYVGRVEITGSGTSVSALPASPYDGQIIFYTADATNGIIWQFRYRAASASSFKWEYVGGTPLFTTINNTGVTGTSETTASNTYVALTTPGPSLTCPLGGDYQVDIGATSNHATSSGVMSYDIGGTGASDNDAFWFGTGACYANHYGTRIKTGLAASTALVSKYRTVSATADFHNRWMRITPVRVG